MPVTCAAAGTGGRLLVAALARVAWLPDLVVDLLSAASEHSHGPAQTSRPALADGPVAGQPVMPVKDPAMTLAQITAATRAHLPGTVLRRRLFATPWAGTSHR